MDIGFAPNYTNIHEIDITPDSAERTWAWLAPGITSIVPSANEVVDDTPYYDGEGMSTKDITGGQLSYAVTGHRRQGDPAQDYIVGRALLYGEERKTNLRITSSKGDVLEGEVTLSDLVPDSANGVANTKGDFSCTISYNKTPRRVEGDGKVLPEKITLHEDTVAVGETVDINPTIIPADAPAKCLYAIEDHSIATVNADGLVTGVTEGETSLTVKSAVKPSVFAQTKITVTAVQPAQAKATMKP